MEMNSNSNFYYLNQNINFCNKTDQEKTTFKASNCQFTPEKKGKRYEEGENMSLDSTMIMSQPTLVKHVSYVSHLQPIKNMQTTPEKSKKKEKKYEATIRTPIKKSKRRECTPAFSDDDEQDEKLAQRSNLPACNLFLQSQLSNFNSLPNYDILKLTGRNTNFNNFNNNFNNFNYNKAPHFEKLSKSKFLDKINSLETANNTSLHQDQENIFIESSEIFEKLKGTYLLCKLDHDCTQDEFGLIVFSSILEDPDLFNKITNLISYSIFEGFNMRSDLYFKFLSPSIFLEIVDKPLDSFNNNMSLLTNHILRLDPEFDNYQIDVVHEEHKYIFSVQGRCTLNTPNKDMMNFITSFRIFLNIGKQSPIRNDEVKLENFISVDYIKLRVY